MKYISIATLVCAVSLVSTCAGAQSDDRPSVVPPPESFFALVNQQDRDAARQFYGKYVDIKGIPVVSSAEVVDLALQRTYEIVSHLLAGRLDVISAMRSNGMYLIVIGKDQRYTDMPEYRNSRNPDYLNERVRGTGGKPTSFGEENLLNLPIDRYDDESIGVHEFCHTIDGALRSLDPMWSARKNEVFQNAKSKGLWKNTYAASNPGEFWAEICQSYFDCNRVNNWNHGPIGTRAQLKEYDPEAYELVRSAFNLNAEQDWHYRPLQKQPTVFSPPARFKIDPYYTKFSWARELPVVGREANSEALLKANDTIRKMFAYRHDILKALIADGVKLAVLGKNERIADLPECKSLGGKNDVDRRARRLSYTPECKLLVVGEEELLGSAKSSKPGGSPVIGEFAKALCHVTATRPVDPNRESRGRDVQQYELRVKRVDIQFDERLKQLYETAMSKGLWKDTTAAKSRVDYWAEGVLAYFDAAGDTKIAGRPPGTRGSLKEYDPELFALVNETMAYEGHTDWRFALGDATAPQKQSSLPAQ